MSFIKNRLLVSFIYISLLTPLIASDVNKEISRKNSITSEDLKKEEERLSEEEKEIYFEFKKSYKEIVRNELNLAINKDPTNKALLSAQYDSLFNQTLIDLARNLRRGKIRIVKEWMMPSIFGSSPPGVASNWGKVYAFATYSPRKRRARLNDSSMGAGFGFGNPDKYLGGSVTIVADSIYKTRKGRSLEIGRIPDFDLGGVNVKVSRNLPFPRGASVAVGQTNTLYWGYKESDKALIGGFHFSYSQAIALREGYQPFSSMQFTLGAGNKNLNPYSDIANGDTGYEPYFGVGMRILPMMGLAVDYIAKEINSTLSFTPFSHLPFYVNFTAANLNGKKPDPIVIYTLTLSAGWSFL